MDEQQVVTTPASGFKFTKKTVLGLVVLLLLITAIPIGVYLSQQKQLFRPKAASLQPISGPEASLSLVAPTSVEPGAQIRVGVWARSDFDAANLFVSKLKFPIDLLEVVSINTGSTQSCQARPACLDSKPACSMPEPEDGWCSNSVTKTDQKPNSEVVVTSEKGTNTSFVKNWIEKTFDNTAGTVSLSGGVPDPGYKTTVGQPSGLMAEVVFKTKKAGSATISFDTGSAIYRNSDNVNVLSIKRDASFKIENHIVITLPISTSTSTSDASAQNLVVNSDFSQGDSGWTFWGSGRPVAGPGQHSIENELLAIQDGGAQQDVTLSPNTTYKLVATVRNSATISNLNAPYSNVLLFSETTEVNGRVGGGMSKELVFRSNTPETKETVFTTPSVTTYKLSMAKASGIDAAYFDNIGIYKVASEVISRSLTPTPFLTPTPSGIRGDVNMDGKVDLVDMSVLLSKMGKMGAEAGRADINSDGIVNTFDYSILLQILFQNGVIKPTCPNGAPRC